MHHITNAIVQFKVSDSSKGNAWRDLVNEVAHASALSPISIPIYLKEHEVEYMEEFYSTYPDAKTKKGKWKTSKYLPNAYLSAKSVICRAAERGLELVDHNETPYGKSELEKRIQVSKSSPGVTFTTYAERLIHKHVNALSKLQSMGFVAEVHSALSAIVNLKE